MGKLKIYVITTLITVCMSFPTYAGQWYQAEGVWEYMQDDGCLLTN